MTRSAGLVLREPPEAYVVHYVIDASVALKWIWSEEESDRAMRYARGAIEREMILSVPTLFWYEVAHALRYGNPRRADGGSDPWSVLLAVPISTVGFEGRAFRGIAELANRYDLTAYDAAYVYLAQSLGVPLITADRRLLERCRDLRLVWRPGEHEV